MKRTELPEGTRVRLTAYVERFPSFSVEAGGLGTVTFNDPDSLCIQMDEHIHGGEDWDNEIVWSPEDDQDFENPPLALAGGPR